MRPGPLPERGVPRLHHFSVVIHHPDQATHLAFGVVRRLERGERAGEPPADVAELIRLIGVAKGLVQDSLARLKG